MLISELTGNIWRGHTVWFDKYWPNRPLLPVVYTTLLIKFYKLGSIMTRNANSATQKLRKKFSQNGVSLKETKWRKKYEGNADSCVDWLHAFQMNQLCRFFSHHQHSISNTLSFISQEKSKPEAHSSFHYIAPYIFSNMLVLYISEQGILILKLSNQKEAINTEFTSSW